MEFDEKHIQNFLKLKGVYVKMKTQKIISAVMGVVLLALGLTFLFNTLNISPKYWLLPTVGVIVFITGIKMKKRIVTGVGVAVILYGIAALISVLILPFNYHSALYYGTSAVILFVFSAMFKIGWFSIVGIGALSVSLYRVISYLDISGELKTAYLLICIASLIAVFFILSYEKFGYTPLVISVLFYLLSIPKFLENASYINGELSDIISAVLLILSGALLVLKVYKSGTKEKKSEREEDNCSERNS